MPQVNEKSLKEEIAKQLTAETLFHHIDHKFGFWDRIRILIRGRLSTVSEIALSRDNQVLSSKTQTIIPRLSIGKLVKNKIKSNDNNLLP